MLPASQLAKAARSTSVARTGNLLASRMAPRAAANQSLMMMMRNQPVHQRAVLQRFSQQSIRNYSASTNGNSHDGQKRAPFSQRVSGFFKKLLGVTAVIVAVPLGYTLAFFVYDYTTYEGGPLITHVQVPKESLDLKKGGPQNLVIADSFVDDIELGHTPDKPRLVILGSGWGAVAMLNKLDTSKYNVTLISPNNHFLFTPMLPSAAVGTLSLDTLVEPMRHICRRKNVRLLQAAGHDVSFDDKLLEVRSETDHFYVPYDKLVIATGAGTNTHGVKGLENAYFFKTAADCEKLRSAICNTLEIAALPSTDEQERRRLLSFVVCGGGPTGVELASEIYDLLKEDMPKMYPNLLVNLASVHIIQSRSAILNTYDETISQYAMDRFMHDDIDLLTNARVQEVLPDGVVFSRSNAEGKKDLYKIPSGITLWTTGVGLVHFVQRVMSNLKEYQHNRHALETDSHLRVIGAPLGDVYAIGDCSTVRIDLANELETLIRKQLKSSQIHANDEYDMKTIDECLLTILKNEPAARQHLLKLREKLTKWHRQDDTVHLNRVIEDLKRVDTKVTSLPATAQRANQQGLYLAHKLNRLVLATPDMLKGVDNVDSQLYRAFSYHHLGSLAYISNGAVFDTGGQIGFNLFGGVLAVYLWRSVYMSQTVTYRARVHMFFDWLYRGLFGRQIYTYDRVAKADD